MNTVRECEARLGEHYSARQNIADEIRGIPEVIVEGVRAVRERDHKAFGEFAQRVLLGAGATTFTRVPGTNRKLIKARMALLTSQDPLDEALSAKRGSRGEPVTAFYESLRGSLTRLVELYDLAEYLDSQLRTDHTAIEFTLTNLAAGALYRGEVITRGDLGDSIGVEAYFKSLAAECAWTRENDVIRTNLLAQLTALADDAPEAQERFAGGWVVYVYDRFEANAERLVPWAAALARSSRPTADDPQVEIKRMIERGAREAAEVHSRRPRRGIEMD